MALYYPDRPIDCAVLLGANADDLDEDRDELVVSCVVDGHEDRNPSMVVGVATGIPGQRLFVHCRVCDASRVAATLERMQIGLGKPPAGAALWRYDEMQDDADDAERGQAAGDAGKADDDGELNAEQKRRADEDRRRTQAQLDAVRAFWDGGTAFRRGDEAWQYLTRHRGFPDGGPWETALMPVGVADLAPLPKMFLQVLRPSP